MEELRLKIDSSSWKEEVLADLFGEEDVYNITHDGDKRFEVTVIVQRGKEVKEEEI